MLRRKDKEQIVKKITDEFKQAKSVVFTDYKGLSANEVTELRKKLRAEDVSYQVVKKSLIQIALNNLKVTADIKNYEGPVAVAVSEKDEVMPAKLVAETAKKNENLKMVGGVLENKFLDEAEIKALSLLPGKDELIAKAVGSISAPVRNFVGVLGGVTRQLVYVLKAIEEKKA